MSATAKQERRSVAKAQAKSTTEITDEALEECVKGKVECTLTRRQFEQMRKTREHIRTKTAFKEDFRGVDDMIANAKLYKKLSAAHNASRAEREQRQPPLNASAQWAAAQVWVHNYLQRSEPRRAELDAKDAQTAYANSGSHPAPRIPPRQHVMYATDERQFEGLAASIASVVDAAGKHAGHVDFTVVVPPAFVKAAHEVASCALGDGAERGARVRTIPWDDTSLEAVVAKTRKWVKQRGNLSSATNFARFYLPRFFPPSSGVERVLYLDADTTVHCDVTDLLARTLRDHTQERPPPVIAAAPRLKPGFSINLFDDYVKSLGFRSASHWRKMPSFNAGVFVAHLGRWRATNATQRLLSFQRYIKLQANATTRHTRATQPPPTLSHRRTTAGTGSLYSWGFGSQAPLQAVFGTNFQHLPKTWNFGTFSAWLNPDKGEGKGWPTLHAFRSFDLGDACVRHFNGRAKPWEMADAAANFSLSMDKHGDLRALIHELWRPYARPHCTERGGGIETHTA